MIVCPLQLHTRETWLKEGRLVRVDEKAYRMVKARPKKVSTLAVVQLVRKNFSSKLIAYLCCETFNEDTQKEDKRKCFYNEVAGGGPTVVGSAGDS